MPQSITLTVSHLPTSTSFFLSALQPLSYIYRGRSGSTIGFGPSEPLSAPPDFWITQETPGVPAGAAHVAFPAKSREAVREFFHAAVKAGGVVYGEPKVRDGWGYYSAAVVDMDGNSVEAVHRPEMGAGGEEDKENDVRSLVRSKSLRAPSVMSRAESAIAVSEAPSRKSSPSKGDALDHILNEAKNTADKAREFVDHIRPKIDGSKSSPATPQQTNTSNGGPSDAIVGTLLGVAAGAALHYAFANRNGGASSGSDPESEPTRSRGRRPSVQGRSMTTPSSVSRSSAGGGRYITMEDNDYASTIRPSSRRSRRGSFDSGIGISPPSPSTASRISKASASAPRKQKLLEAAPPPPSSYRGPPNTADARSLVSARSTSKRSASLTRGDSASRRRSSISDNAETVLHIRETVRMVDTFPSASPSHSHSQSTSKSKSKPPSRSSSHAASKPPSPPSHSKSSRTSTVRPENHPLPPSRASTWTDGQSEASYSTARPTRSVIGKVNEARKLKFARGKEGELTPADSVSQISVNTSRGGRR